MDYISAASYAIYSKTAHLLYYGPSMIIIFPDPLFYNVVQIPGLEYVAPIYMAFAGRVKIRWAA